MAQADNSKATANAVKNAQSNWNNFVKASSICGGIAFVILALMALLLV